MQSMIRFMLTLFALAVLFACSSQGETGEVACLTETDCPVGEICSEGLCVPGISDTSDGDVFSGECRRDIECQPGYYCEENFCVPMSVDGDDPTDGDEPDGDAIVIIDGDKTDGDETADGDDIIVVDGDLPDGDGLVDGDLADGDDIDGDADDGEFPDGDGTDIDSPDADLIDGDVVDGDAPDGDIADGDEADGDALEEEGTCELMGCYTGSQSRAGCGEARLIGRQDAADAGAYNITYQQTCGAGNYFDGAPVNSCEGSGGGADHSYRIFMLAGESIAIRIFPDVKCGSDDFATFTFSIWTNDSCSESVCPTALYCQRNISYVVYNDNFTATADGWYFLVIDGNSANDSGEYDFKVTLTCNEAGCGC